MPTWPHLRSIWCDQLMTSNLCIGSDAESINGIRGNRNNKKTFIYLWHIYLDVKTRNSHPTTEAIKTHETYTYYHIQSIQYHIIMSILPIRKYQPIPLWYLWILQHIQTKTHLPPVGQLRVTRSHRDNTSPGYPKFKSSCVACPKAEISQDFQFLLFRYIILSTGFREGNT